MPLKESYVVWNNKGGVGKTTLTFHMATRYANRNPSVRVLVIDLCPQANVSMALLSSPEIRGNVHLSALFREKKTISNYLQRLMQMKAITDTERYLTRVREFNEQVPSTLFLLCGDMCLELVGRGLDHYRTNMDMPQYSPWKHATTGVRSFIEGLPEQVTGVTNDHNDWVVFIDTNPSFSVYTEIALAAANKLIIPINADDFSVEAVRTMLDLVYGIDSNEEQDEYAVYRNYMFSKKAPTYQLRVPKIHLLVNNRVTTISTRSAKAFKAMGQENLKVLFEAYQQHQDTRRYFSHVEQILKILKPSNSNILKMCAISTRQPYYQSIPVVHFMDWVELCYLVKENQLKSTKERRRIAWNALTNFYKNFDTLKIRTADPDCLFCTY